MAYINPLCTCTTLGHCDACQPQRERIQSKPRILTEDVQKKTVSLARCTACARYFPQDIMKNEWCDSCIANLPL